MNEKHLNCRSCGVVLPRFEHRPGAWVICVHCGEAFFIEQLLSSVDDASSEELDDILSDDLELTEVPRDATPTTAPKPAADAPPPKLAAETPPSAKPAADAFSLAFAKEVSLYDQGLSATKTRQRIRYELDPTPDSFFFSGVFDFPWRAGTRSHWIVLSVTAILVGELAIYALGMTGLTTNDGPTSEMPVGIGVGLAALFFFFLLIGYLSASLMAVIEDTANGCDQIQEWPEGDWRDWMPKVAPLVMAGLVAMLLGFSLKRFAGVSEIRSAVAGFFIFPVALMSMLEAGSLFTPLSVPILKTFFHWRTLVAWIVFYIETGLLTAALAGAIWLTPPERAAEAIAILAFPLTAALLIYARLLGRWSWYSSLDHRGGDEEEEESE